MLCNQHNNLKIKLCYSFSSFRRGGGEVLERICSKLGGGLERTICDIDSSVAPIEGPYATRAGDLQDMVLRNVDCANLSAEYSLIDSHFSIIEALKAANNKEPDLYFYHSDHLGSSSFITDADGIVSQHLQYLPYGELFVEQRDNTARYYTPYKFSGKEKDEETGYSYFGARYYMSDVSVWLSVDPMADKRSWLSPYNYCQNNPIMLTDPDGMLDDDIYKNKKGEEVARIPNNLPNRVYNVTPDGQGGWVVQNEPPSLPGTSVPGVEVTEKRGEPLNTYERLMRNPVIAARNQYHPMQTFMWGAATAGGGGAIVGAIKGAISFYKFTNSLFKSKPSSTIQRSIDNHNSLEGATPKEIEDLIPSNWIRGPLKKGKGIKYVNPDKKGEQILYEEGWENAQDPMHAGPYLKISKDGKVIRVPLKGNPTLNQ